MRLIVEKEYIHILGSFKIKIHVHYKDKKKMNDTCLRLIKLKCPVSELQNSYSFMTTSKGH